MDMRGRLCPVPVIEARRALVGGAETATVDVDNEIAVENLEKMAAGAGHGFFVEQVAQGHYRVTIGGGEKARADEPASGAGGLTVAIGSECMGTGAEELGRMLMKGFIFSLGELKPLPERIIFYNSGAKLTTERANTVPDLLSMEQRGTEVYTCGTCANHFGIKDALAVGEITDMMHIVQMMADAARLVRP